MPAAPENSADVVRVNQNSKLVDWKTKSKELKDTFNTL